MRLKIPKATRQPRTAEESSEDRCWGSSVILLLLEGIKQTLLSKILWTMTTLHSTSKVSTEFEKV